MKGLWVAIVMPYRNEQELLESTCASLGFGTGQNSPENSMLILVDNGSTDQSVALARSIAAASPPGRVLLTYEQEPGFVPPRRHGNAVAAQVAPQMGVGPDQVLILQCDADTTYRVKYIYEMRAAAEQAGRGVLLQALTAYPDGFRESYPAYAAYCDRGDSKLENLLRDHPDQILVDDKVAGYYLEDYLLWGGHRCEFFSSREEIDAETTRLFMRAKSYGCKLVSVGTAQAEHSVRKVLSEPALELATAGFPRETSWMRCWAKRTAAFGGMAEFLASAPHDLVEEAIALRRKHTLALFGLLRIHVAHALNMTSSVDHDPEISNFILPNRSLDILRAAPAIFIEDVFRGCNLIAE